MTDGGQKPKSSAAFHFLAGLSSGTTTAILLQPADLLKTRVQQSGGASLTQTLGAILRGPSPIPSLWRGTVPSVIRTGAGSALYFGLLNQLRLRIQPVTAVTSPSVTSPTTPGSRKPKPKPNNGANLLTGAIARASAGAIMSPVTVLKVRYESSLYAYTSLLSALRDIFRTSGPKGFFAGFGATAVRDAPYAGLYVLFYEQCKHRLGEGTSAVGNFTSGVVAATAATGVTNPFDAIKTRLQLQPGVYGNMWVAGAKMCREEGVRCLFDGLGIRIARKALSSALAWTVYEELIRRAERVVPVAVSGG